METVTQKGRFGKYGGRYVPETLIPALDELEQQYDRCRQDHLFQEELAYYLRRYCGRPTGSRTLNDAVNEALRDWVSNRRTTFYVIGSVVGPHPDPSMVRDFQSVIGREVRTQITEEIARLPDYLVACVRTSRPMTDWK